MNKNLNKILIVLIIFSIILSVFSSFYFQKYAFISNDNEQHFYDMRTGYDNRIIPHTGARLVTSGKIIDENAVRVPGAGFYARFISLYFISNGNYYMARIFDVSLYLIVLFIFLIWAYFRFGLTALSVLTAFISVNCIFFEAVTSFTNPNPVVMFSFLFVIFFAEYLRDKKFSKIFASLLFPILAIMGQFHFAVYYGIVPTLIIYLIIKFNYSKKYLSYLALGVFLSFLLYLPYLITEMQNGFENSLRMINLSKEYTVPFYKRFPQIYAQIIFPTFTLNKFDIKTILNFWDAASPFMIIIILISHIIVIASFVISFICIVLNKNIFEKIKFKNDNLIKELLFFYFLYIPVAIVCPILLKGKGGGYVYHFSMFAMSFFTILLFVNYLFYKKPKLFNYFIIFLFIHIFAVSWHYYKQTYKSSSIGKKQKLTYDIVKHIGKDANGKIFKLYSRDIFNYASWLFLNKKENNISENPNIEYLIIENINSTLYRFNDDDRIKEREPHKALTLYYWYSPVNKPNTEDISGDFDIDNSKLIYTNELFALYKKDLRLK